MEIQSAFNAGIQGFQKAKEEATQAAENTVVQASASREESIATETVNSQTLNSQIPATNEQKIPELNQSIVDLKVAEFQAKSSAQVIKTADDVLGTLVDVTA